MQPGGPSEEMTIHCDAPECGASLNLVAGVGRDMHGWGRISIYTREHATDYDLCQTHYKRILEGLWSGPA